MSSRCVVSRVKREHRIHYLLLASINSQELSELLLNSVEMLEFLVGISEGGQRPWKWQMAIRCWHLHGIVTGEIFNFKNYLGEMDWLAYVARWCQNGSLTITRLELSIWWLVCVLSAISWSNFTDWASALHSWPVNCSLNVQFLTRLFRSPKVIAQKMTDRFAYFVVYETLAKFFFFYFILECNQMALCLKILEIKWYF